MNTRLSLVSLAIFVIAGLFLVIPMSAYQPAGGLPIGLLSQAPGQNLSGFPAPVEGSRSTDFPQTEVLATKSPLFRNSTDTVISNQGNVIQAKPVVAPGFKDPATGFAAPKLSVPSIGGMARQNQSPAVVRPVTTPASTLFPVPTSTGTPGLKANMFASGQSALPKIPFPPLNPVPVRTETPATTDYVTNSTRTIEQRIFYYTNIERSKAGKLPYIYDSKLSDIGREDAVDMIVRNFFDHTNPDGESPSDRAKRHGYPIEKDYGSYYRIGVGENIAWVQHLQGTPDEIAQYIVNAWMNSPDHRENILDLNGADYTNLGVGVAYDPIDDKYLAAQEFF